MDIDILHLLFNGKFKELVSSTNLDIVAENLSQLEAIYYVDLDDNIKIINYWEILNSCLQIYERLKILNISSVNITNVLDDNNRKSKFNIRHPLVIYGDCAEWTPIFMIVANMLQLPFYYINDQKTLFEAIKQFRSINLLNLFVTHKNRLKELSQILLCNNISCETLDYIFRDFLFLYDKTSLTNLDNNVNTPELNISYIINTSGTSKSLNNDDITVVSKNVFVSHRSISANVIDFQKEYHLIDDVMLICSPFTFDPSICDLFLGLSSYCRIILMDNSLKNIPEKFVSIIFRFGINYITITPSLWYRISGHLLDRIQIECSVPLVYVNFGGEMCPTIEEMKKFQYPITNIKFYNLYGLSEMSVWACLCKLNENIKEDCLDPLPILGRSLLDTQVYLSDQEEIIIESSTRKCLLYDGHRWTFVSKLFTNDNGKKIGSCLYFIKRKGTDDCIKLNGIKLYPKVIERLILNKFGHNKDNKKNFYIENCYIQPGKWENISLIDIVLVIVSSSNDSIYPPQIQREIINFIMEQQFDYCKIAFRLHMIDSSQIIFNYNGKIDYGKIKENIDKLQMPMYKQWSKHEIELKLEEILFKYLHFNKNDKKHPWTYGMNSMLALEITMELDNEFIIQNESLYEILFTESFDGIVNRIYNITIHRDSSVLLKQLPYEQALNIAQCITRIHSNVPKLLTTNDKSSITFYITYEWSYFMEQCVDSSPLIVILEQKIILISSSHSGLICAFDITFLNKLPYQMEWCQRISSRIEASPVASNDGSIIYVTDYSGFIRAFQTLSGRPVWQFRTKDQIKCSPTVFAEQKLILCGSFDHNLYCWKQYCGQLQWQTNVNKSSIFSSPILWHNDDIDKWFVVVCTLNGAIACCYIESGQIYWKNSYSNKPIFSTPKIYENDLLIVGMTDSRIISVSLRDGKLIWELDIYNPIFSSPCLIQHEENLLIIMGTNGRKVVCSIFNSTESLWIFNTESNIYADVLFCKELNVLLVIETNGKLHILNPNNGKLLSSNNFIFPDKVFSSPLVYQDKLFVGCRDSNIYCLDIKIKSCNNFD